MVNRSPEVAIVAMGEMGSWVARRLTAHGAAVRTVLDGRSAASADRAAAAGVRDAGSDDALVEGADMLLSIVPPGAAFDLARRFAPALARAKIKPVYVDCNAVSRGTVLKVEHRIAAAGGTVVDAGIFGVAPVGDGAGPRIYVSGPEAAKVGALNAHGLEILVLDAPVGSASALKCCFAALGKGVAALGAEAILAAQQANVAEALQLELRTIFPDLARLLAKLVPESYTKAYRWVAEMQEIGRDFEAVPGGTASYNAAAELFQAVAQAGATRGIQGNLIDSLDLFVTALKAAPAG